MKTFMKGQLKLMNKKEVVDICYNICKAIGKPDTKENLNLHSKEYLIRYYGKVRNAHLLGVK